jgi:hypothetical protein
MSSGVQLPLGGTSAELPLDPFEVAELQAPERGALHRKAGLDPLQVDAVEQAVRLVLAGRYRRSYGRGDRAA